MNKTLVWAAKGKKPKWLIDLELNGEKAVELSGTNVLKAS